MNQGNDERKLIREPEVLAMLSMSRTTFKRLRKERVIPEPIHPGGRKGTYWPYWEICELIERWAAERYISSSPPPATEEKIEHPREQMRHSATERRKPRVGHRHAA
jgi:predicted DNA-binding transcriptional regulator AlpA